MRHNRIAITVITVEYGCVALRMRFFPQNFGTIKRILPGSSSPSHREGPGIEVGEPVYFLKSPSWRGTVCVFLLNFSLIHNKRQRALFLLLCSDMYEVYFE